MILVIVIAATHATYTFFVKPGMQTQLFKNNVETLGNLNSSVRIKENEFSNASNFNIIFRN